MLQGFKVWVSGFISVGFRDDLGVQGFRVSGFRVLGFRDASWVVL